MAAHRAPAFPPEARLPARGGALSKAAIEIRAALDGIGTEAGIDASRAAFLAVTTALLPVVEDAGSPLAVPLTVVHCPMAFDFEGADWLQLGDTVANPYFGDEMLRCGSVQREIAAEK